MRQPPDAPAPPNQGQPRQPTILVGSDDGAAALLRAKTGTSIWKASSGREVGTLAHDGEHFYVAFGSRLRLIRSRRHESREQELRRHDRIRAEPSCLEARDTRNGALIWRKADWNLIGSLNVGVSADVVLVASTSVYGDRALYALDAHSGASLWSFGALAGRSHSFTICGGVAYLYNADPDHGLLALDARTGATLWSSDAPYPHLIFSPDHSLMVEQRWRLDQPSLARVLDARTGVPRIERPLHGAVRAVSNNGIAYITTGDTIEYPGLAAVRLQDGSELWRVDDVMTYQIACSDAAVYCAQLLPSSIGEVSAFDARTGQRLWRWQTPENLRALLSLWGPPRTLQMLAYATQHATMNVAGALAERSRRDVPITLWREIHDGQWRKPQALHGAVNAMWLATGWDIVFLGTRLGIFALNASDGHLLWHALPTTDLSFFPCALPPQ